VSCSVNQRDLVIYRDSRTFTNVWLRVLRCVAVCYSVLHRIAVCCSVLQCVAVRCSVLQCVAVSCSVN